MSELYDIERVSADVSMENFMDKCVDIPQFLGYCRECRNYRKRWSCPSFDFDPMEIWEKYSSVHIEGRVLRPLEGVTLEQAVRGMEAVKQDMLAELMHMEAETPQSLVLSAGACYLCGDNCARLNGEPCRFPNKMRYSMESLGGDVNKAAEIFLHRPMQWIKNGEMPEYLMLVLGLLLP